MKNQLHNTFTQARSEIGLGICLSLLTAALIWSQTEQSRVHTWLLLVTTVYALRYGLIDYLNKHRNLSQDTRSNYLLLLGGIALSGLTWAGLISNSPYNFSNTDLNYPALAAASVLAFVVFILYFGKLDMVMSFALTALMVPLLTLLQQWQQHAAVIVLLCLWTACLAFACLRLTKKLNNIPVPKASPSQSESKLKQQNFELTQELKLAETRVTELQQALKLTSLDLESYQNKADALSITLNQINPFDLESGLLTEHKHKNILQREWARMNRLNLPITLIYLSLDEYEKYEETHDKHTCKMTLKRIVKIINATCKRPGDVFAKLKNQQIAILLPETDLDDSLQLANSICQQVEGLGIKHANNASNPLLTASLGVASVIPNDLLTEGEFLKRADSALYEAKFQGGNRVLHYSSHPDLKLLHWDEQEHGPMQVETLSKKINRMSFETERNTYQPGVSIKNRRTHSDSIIAVISGCMLVTVEGDANRLRPGDRLLIPKSMNYFCEVEGNEAVDCIEGNR